MSLKINKLEDDSFDFVTKVPIFKANLLFLFRELGTTPSRLTAVVLLRPVNRKFKKQNGKIGTKSLGWKTISVSQKKWFDSRKCFVKSPWIIHPGPLDAHQGLKGEEFGMW